MAGFDLEGHLVMRLPITRTHIAKWLAHFGLPSDETAIQAFADWFEQTYPGPRGNGMPPHVYWHLHEQAGRGPNMWQTAQDAGYPAPSDDDTV